VTRFGNDPDADIREYVADGMERKVLLLSRLERADDAIAASDEMLGRYADAAEPTIRRGIWRTLLRKTYVLLGGGRVDEGIVVADALVAGIDSVGPNEADDLVSAAMLVKTLGLFTQDRYEEALELCDMLVSRFGDSDDRVVRGNAVQALGNKAACMLRLGELDEALNAQREMATRFGDDAVAAFDRVISDALKSSGALPRSQVAEAMARKAFVLCELGKRDEAEAILVDLIARYSDDDDTMVQMVRLNAEDFLRQLRDESDEDDI
jgi:tetratricopeptide (TPR) repeat protein